MTPRFVDALSALLLADLDRPSLVEDATGEVTTAGGLLRRAAAIRAGLAARGVAPGERVALLGPACVDWVATDLACLAEGLVVLPLDGRQAPGDRAALLATTTPRVVVCVGGVVAEGVSEGVTAAALAAGSPAEAWSPPRALGPEAPATIVATSGSTGQSKGVVLTHGGLDFMLRRTTWRLAELTGAAPVGSDPDRGWPAPSPAAAPERVLQVLPPNYAGSRVLLLSALLRGARVRLLADPRRFGEAMAAEGPHTTLVVPLLLERLRRAVREGVAARGRLAAGALAAAEAAWERIEAAREAGAAPGWRDRLVVDAARRTLLAPVRRRLGPDLRGVICGSAPLDPAVQRFVRLLGVEVYQGYGLTETTALVTLDREGQVRPGFVGPPLPGVEVRLDEAGQLLTRGPHVFPGYFGLPAREGEWYATGDLAEQDERGRLRILGRADALLALTTGHKVPPEEVEEALRGRLGPDAQLVVVGHGRPHLVALVFGATRAAVDAALAAHAATASPSRRVHAAHVRELPLGQGPGDAELLTSNLKLRRRAIAARFAAEVERLYGQPRVPA